jgi:hypothetical protein
MLASAALRSAPRWRLLAPISSAITAGAVGLLEHEQRDLALRAALQRRAQFVGAVRFDAQRQLAVEHAQQRVLLRVLAAALG